MIASIVLICILVAAGAFLNYIGRPEWAFCLTVIAACIAAGQLIKILDPTLPEQEVD